MLLHLTRRFLQAIPTLWLIATLTFFLLHLAPGGPFDDEKSLDPAIKAQVEAHFGFDQPLYQQYFKFMGNLLKGELGPSYKYAGWNVDEIIVQSFPVSLELGGIALIIAISIGVPIGVTAALRHGKASEAGLMAFAMIGICLPTFVLGPLLLLIFSSYLGWFNTLGWNLPGDRVLPAITLGLFYAGYITRLARTGMLEVLQQDYIRTAKAKGLSSLTVINRHALRTGLYPVTSYMGPAIAGLISGSFVVETIFFIPGLGQFFVNSAFNRDYTLVMGTVLFYAVLILLFNLIVDMVQMWINPRTRHD